MPKPMDRPNRRINAVERDPEYAGKPVIVVGGGPSLYGFDFEPYKDIPTIAVNQSCEVVPWSKYLLFADFRWFKWNEPLARAWPGKRVTVGIAAYPDDVPVIRMIRVKDGGLCTQPTELAGIDSGCLAVNLAFHLGASRIILLGFDSGFGPRADGIANASHVHDKHQVPTNDAFYRDRYGPRLSGLCQRLRDVGVPVVRSTDRGRPDIPYVPLPDALTAPLPPCEGLITEFIP